MRSRVGILLAVVSGLFSVLLAVAVNVATGGTLPAPLDEVSWLAWPAVGVLGVAGAGLAFWQQSTPQPAPPPLPGPAPSPDPPALTAPAELPAATPLFGRDAEVAEIVRVLSGESPVVTLAAAPGTGKTSLALGAAHALRPRFPDGQLFATLRGASAEPLAPEAVLGRFLTALGVPEDERRGSTEELAARFRSAVADRAVLVLLDDARDAAHVTALLPGGARCATIVTSRRQLTGVANAHGVPLAALPEDAAVELLERVAGADTVRRDPDGTRALVAACAGLPLAVLIVAGRLRARPQWTPSALAERLAGEHRRLDELRQGDLAVRSTFQAAYAELSEVDRLVFRRAGSHPGQVFTLAEAGARAGVGGTEAEAAMDRLVDAFLIESPGPDRFHLHDLLRLFATETLTAQEHADASERLLGWLLRRPAGALDVAGLPAVLTEGVETGRHHAVTALVDAVHGDVTDPFDRLAVWTAAAEAAGQDSVRRARALRWVSHSLTVAGEVQRALPPADEALALAEAAGDQWETAQAVRRRGEALRDLHRFAESEAALLRSLDLFVELGRAVDEVDVRTALGTLYNNFRRHELSVPMMERARELLPAVESVQAGWVRLALALAYRFAGRRTESDAIIAEVPGIATRAGNDYLLAYYHQELAWIAEGDGRWDDAERAFTQMRVLAERVGSGAAIGGALVGLGHIAERRDDLDTALTRFREGVERYARLGDRFREGEARLRVAVVLNTQGHVADAVAERATAEALIGDSEYPWGEGLLSRLPTSTSGAVWGQAMETVGGGRFRVAERGVANRDS
ncbi:NB-ARC domain-containing protein, partial [Dactylosporangium sp. NPDC049525]|uniref:ATP-binding protein n=1 Tax=Dactylosporangium sp. NPDC049525 TaxID=3154730 RepID=UPI00341F1E9F